jgi:hypothetical protein
MSKDWRCECGHAMAAQHGPDGCMANGCPCTIQSLREDERTEALAEAAAAAWAQTEAFIRAGFTREEAVGLTKELMLVMGRAGG